MGLLNFGEDPLTMGLLGAAGALMTPQHRGGGFGQAFGAFAQGGMQAGQMRRQRQQDELTGKKFKLLEDELGLKRTEMDRKEADSVLKRMQEEQQAVGLDRIIAGLPPEQQALARAMPQDFLKTMLPQKPVQPPEIVQLYEQMEQLPPNHPLRAILKGAIDKKTTHAPAPSATATTYVLPQTPGQKSVDTKFGQDFVEFATGGFSDVQKQLQQLQQARTSLASGRSMTGPLVGSLSDPLLSVVNPEALGTRERIEEVVQRNLRLILGAQFTEREGERLIARAYNPRLSEAENLRRLDLLIEQISSAAQAKLDASQYFMKHGSLTGWQGRLPRLSDFDPDAKSESKAAVPKISSDAEFNALPSGAEFIDPKGQKRRKP